MENFSFPKIENSGNLIVINECSAAGDINAIINIDEKKQKKECDLLGVKCGIPSKLDEIIGRDNTIDSLFDWIEEHRFVALTGMAGIGKTVIALHCVKKWIPDKFQTSLLINMENEQTVENSVKSFLTYLNIEPNTNTLENMKIIYGFFKTTKCLVILDNIENKNDFLKYIWLEADHNTNIFILATSQYTELSKQFYCVKLNVLSVDDSVDLLNNGLRNCGVKFLTDNCQAIRELAGILDFHPLALKLSTAIIIDKVCNENKEYSVTQYIKAHIQKLQEDVPLDFQCYYNKTVYVSVETNIHKVKVKSDEAYRFFSFMTLMDPTDIRQELFSKSFKDINVVLRILTQYSIIQIENNEDHTITLHRLFQDINQHLLQKNNEFDFYKSAIFEMLTLCAESKQHVRIHFKYLLQFFTSEKEITKNYQILFENNFTLKTLLVDELEMINEYKIKCFCQRLTSEDWRACHYAAYLGHGEVMKKLRLLNYPINCVTKSKWSVLHSVITKTSFRTNYLIRDEVINDLKLLPYSVMKSALSIFMRKIKNEDVLDSEIFITELFLRIIKNKKSLSSYYIERIKNQMNFMSNSLITAAIEGFDNAIQLFIETKYDLNTQDNEKCTPVLLATMHGNLNAVKKLTEAGADINISNDLEFYPITATIYFDQFDILKFFISSVDFDINKTYSSQNFNLLHIAAIKGQLYIIKHIVNHTNISKIKLCLEQKTLQGFTPIHFAAYNGHLEVLKYFISLHNNYKTTDHDGFTPLHLAAQEGHLNIVKYLINMRENDYSKCFLEQTTSTGGTPLHLAILKGHLSCIKYLISIKANYKQINFARSSPLHLAALGGRLNIVKYLISLENNNIDSIKQYIEQTNTFGFTSLHMAVNNNHLEVLKYLTKFNVNVKGVDVEGFTPLHMAAGKGYLEIVKYLVNLECNSLDAIEQKNFKGCTALHFAVLHGYLDVLKYLIDSNADYKATTETGFAPVHLAAREGHLDTLKYLVSVESKVGGDVQQFLETKTIQGFRPAHLAAMQGHLHILEYLVSLNVNLKEVDMMGFTPFHNAAFQGHINIIKYLIELEKCKTETKTMDSVLKLFEQKTIHGFTALEIAVSRGHIYVYEYLVYLLKTLGKR